MDNSFKIKKGLQVEPTALAPTVKGDLTVDTTSGDMKYHNGTVVASVSTDTNTQTLENKSISGNDNTLTDIPASALVPLTANKAVASDGAGGLVASATTDTELGYVSGVTSAIQTQLNGKQATGNYVTALTGDVTASGPGSVAATVALVGGSSAANVNAATLLANAATDANTASTIVKRDADGNTDLSSFTLEELAVTPSNPAVGSDKVYFKTDGSIYKLNSSGVETILSGGSGVQSKCIYVDAILGSDTLGEGGSVTPYQTITYALSQITDNNINSYTLIIQGDFTAEGTISLKKNVSLVGLGNKKDNLVSVILDTLEAFDTNQLLCNYTGSFSVSSATDLNVNTYMVQDVVCSNLSVFADVAGTTLVTLSNVDCSSVPTFTHATSLKIRGCSFTGSSFGQTLRIRGGTNAIVRGSKIQLSVHGSVEDALTPTLDIDNSASPSNSISGAISAIRFSGYSVRGSSGNATLLGYGSPTTLLLDTVAAGADITVSLPLAADYMDKPIAIKKVTGGAFKVLITPNGAEEIDGFAAAYELVNENQSITIVSAEGIFTGGWRVIATVGEQASSTTAIAAQMGLNVGPSSRLANAPIIMDTVFSDTTSSYSIATGLYTVPVTGVYKVSFTGHINFPAFNVATYISKNGATSGMPFLVSCNSTQFLNGSQSIDCIAGDTLTVQADTAANWVGISTNYVTFLSIERIK